MTESTDNSHLDKPTNPLNLIEIFVFCILLATLASLIQGYLYGVGDTIERIAMVNRQLDPSYCPHDFMVNANTSFGPRTYYVRFLALLGSILPLPIVFLTLTWLTNFSLTLVTYLAAKDLFRKSDLVAMIASTFVMGTTGITPGSSGDLFLMMMHPSHFVYPLALFSIWAATRGKIIICAISASTASIFHPVVGFETGLIGLSAASLSVLFDWFMREKSENKETWKKISVIIFGIFILGGTTAFLWAGKTTKSLDTKQFIDIVAHFRSPHHHVPSTWHVLRYIRSICLILAFFISWKWWYNDLKEDKALAYKVLMPVVVLLVLWCCGYIFVEVFPSRLWTIAQTFRFAFIFNWLAFLVIARTVSHFLTKEDISGKACGWLILMGSGYTQPVLAFLGHVAEIIRTRTKNILSKNVINLVIAVLFIGSSVLLSLFGNIRPSLAILTFVTLIIWFLLLQANWYRSVTPLLALGILVSGVTVNRYHKIPVISNLLDKLNPTVSLLDAKAPEDDVALYARKATPETAVFLTPPDLGRFRLVARRAIIVDFKCFLFQDWAMVEWRKRLADCYGETKKGGYDAVAEMDNNYRTITKEKLLFVAQKYGASYAVLYKDTPCEFPVLFEGKHFKLAKIISDK